MGSVRTAPRLLVPSAPALSRRSRATVLERRRYDRARQLAKLTLAVVSGFTAFVWFCADLRPRRHDPPSSYSRLVFIDAQPAAAAPRSLPERTSSLLPRTR
jgi:hypothetical protein